MIPDISYACILILRNEFQFFRKILHFSGKRTTLVMNIYLFLCVNWQSAHFHFSLDVLKEQIVEDVKEKITDDVLNRLIEVLEFGNRNAEIPIEWTQYGGEVDLIIAK